MDRYRSLPDYRRNLGLLVHFLKADGLKVVLMTEPFLYKDAMPPEERAVLWFGKTFCKTRTGTFTYEYPSPSSLRAAMDAFNGATRDLGAAEDVHVIDLAPRIPRTLEYFVDDVHYRAKGARMVATVVAEELGQTGALAGAGDRLLVFALFRPFCRFTLTLSPLTFHPSPFMICQCRATIIVPRADHPDSRGNRRCAEGPLPAPHNSRHGLLVGGVRIAAWPAARGLRHPDRRPSMRIKRLFRNCWIIGRRFGSRT